MSQNISCHKSNVIIKRQQRTPKAPLPPSTGTPALADTDSASVRRSRKNGSLIASCSSKRRTPRRTFTTIDHCSIICPSSQLATDNLAVTHLQPPSTLRHQQRPDNTSASPHSFSSAALHFPAAISGTPRRYNHSRLAASPRTPATRDRKTAEHILTRPSGKYKPYLEPSLPLLPPGALIQSPTADTIGKSVQVKGIPSQILPSLAVSRGKATDSKQHRLGAFVGQANSGLGRKSKAIKRLYHPIQNKDRSSMQRPPPSQIAQSQKQWAQFASDASASSQSSNASPIHRPQALGSWRQQPELCLGFVGLPPTYQVKELWRLCSKHGDICGMTIHVDNNGLSRGTGTIRFSPPPRLAFWSKSERVEHGGTNYFVRFHVKPSREIILPGLINTQRKYPSVMQLEAHNLSIGTMLDAQTMLSLYHTRPQPAQATQGYRYFPITLSQNLEYRELSINFPAHFEDGAKLQSPLNRTEVIRLTISLKQRITIYRKDDPENKDFVFLVFVTDMPPCCYRKLHDDKVFEDKAFNWTERDSLYRQVDVVLDPHSPDVKNRPTALRQPHSIVNLARWTAYAMRFNRAGTANKAYNQFCDALCDHNIVVRELSELIFTDKQPPSVWDSIDVPSITTSKDKTSLELLADVAPLPFPVRYQLEVCISGGWFSEYGLTLEFMERLRAMPTLKACALLEHLAIDRPEQKQRRIADPMTLFEWSVPKESIMAMKHPDWCLIIRSAIITPTTVIYNSPAIEVSNRVIRHFAEHADRFLRVRFLDEKHQGRIYSAVGRSNMNEVFTRVKRTLTNGIDIGNRHYEFLAFGNSQFRENGAYFFAGTHNVTASTIRAWMGDFSDIKIIAKYAARLGQCFSTTRALKGGRPQVTDTPDVYQNGYCFTDGVGRISKLLAQVAVDDFKIRTNTGEAPSVFQFRLGGYKGILAVWPHLKGLQVEMRPSQKKFVSTKQELEIIKWSQVAGLSLNRQLIMVLSALGVPDRVFLKKMRIQLQRIHKAMHDEEAARDALYSSIDVNQMTPLLADMVGNGFQATKEPFVTTLLHLWRAWSIKYLKEKAKINIPKGAVLLGCTDETKSLRGHYDYLQHKLRSPDRSDRLEAIPEVYVQLSNYEGTGRLKVLEGLMLLARNPSLHAGDIRVVKGVRCNELAHLKDVVVLPQTGDRDLASMCSGGDLDGDDYVVCWDLELIPEEWNHPAMDFTPPSPLEKTDRVTIPDITSFFVNYMKNADLGNIAYAHLATADAEGSGVKSQKCIRLAQLHSTAVDYPKTGRPANMAADLKPRKWPHFMEKKNSYHSRKILGQLYDNVKRVDFVPSYDSAFDNRILEAFEVKTDHCIAAHEIKMQYDAAIRRIMAQYDIRTEFEVWSTFVLSHNKTSGEYKFSEELGSSVATLKEQFSDLCVEKAGSRDWHILAPFVAAMYKITSDQMLAALNECTQVEVDENGAMQPIRTNTPTHMPLMSFPWLFPAILGKIARDSKAFATSRVHTNESIWDSAAPQPVPTKGLQDDLAKLSRVETPRVSTSKVTKELFELSIPPLQPSLEDIRMPDIVTQQIHSELPLSLPTEPVAMSTSRSVSPGTRRSSSTDRNQVDSSTSADEATSTESGKENENEKDDNDDDDDNDEDDEEEVIWASTRPTALDKLAALYG